MGQYRRHNPDGARAAGHSLPRSLRARAPRLGQSLRPAPAWLGVRRNGPVLAGDDRRRHPKRGCRGWMSWQALGRVAMVGVSHTTTPVEVRERLAFSAGELPSALARLNGWAPEGVILSTCSRTEIYAVVNESSAEPKQFLSAERPSAGAASLEERWGEEATRHLFRVASGLESIALGEPQILGQIKRALETANEAGTCGLVLSRLFRQAIEVGKRVRSQTSIGTKAPSLARMALDLASTDSRADSLLQLLVVGSGHMGKLAALSAADRASFDVVIVSRNSAAARKL